MERGARSCVGAKTLDRHHKGQKLDEEEIPAQLEQIDVEDAE